MSRRQERRNWLRLLEYRKFRALLDEQIAALLREANDRPR